MSSAPFKIELQHLSITFEGQPIVRDVSLGIPQHSIYALIGPSGSGKTSVLRTINLLSLEVDHAEVAGKVLVDGQDVLDPKVDRAGLRRRIGMAFALPQPLPGSIRYNLTYGPRRAGIRGRAELQALVETSLRSAELWEEVKDRLDDSAVALSGGQQQRLCIARALALSPEVVLLDEPCSGLDPISTYKIEEMMRGLRDRLTWLIVTNNTKQAARVSDRTAFMLAGELIEEGPTQRLFTKPRDGRTADYVEGRFG